MKRTKLKRRTPLRKRSAKRGSVDYRDAQLKKQMFAKWGRQCAFGAKWPGAAQRCSPTLDMAHVYPKSTHPHIRTHILNVLPACRSCHETLHRYPVLATETMLRMLTYSERTALEALARQRR